MAAIAAMPVLCREILDTLATEIPHTLTKEIPRSIPHSPQRDPTLTAERSQLLARRRADELRHQCLYVIDGVVDDRKRSDLYILPLGLVTRLRRHDLQAWRCSSGPLDVGVRPFAAAADSRAAGQALQMALCSCTAHRIETIYDGIRHRRQHDVLVGDRSCP